MRPSLPAVLVGFVVIWLVLDRSAFLLGSFVGEHGLLVAAMTLAVAVAVEMVLTRRKPGAALAELGLRSPRAGPMALTVVLCLVLLAFFPLYAIVAGAPFGLRTGWAWAAVGILAQGGVAEEALFRGFLFRHFRQGRSFWRAAVLSAIPFAAVHLLLFLTLDMTVAAVSFALSVALSFPFAWLFERAGNSVWPPALLHAVVQGAIKLFVVAVPDATTVAVLWMALSAILPWTVFLLRPAHPPA